MNPGSPNEGAVTRETAAHPIRARKYHQAAIVYFGYGVLYPARIIALGERSGWNLHGYSPLYAWILLPLGLAVTIGFPILIWRRARRGFDGVSRLAALPFDPRFGAATDAGRPDVLQRPDSPTGRAIRQLAGAVRTFFEGKGA